jgi:DNA helicase-2/ATP-dependent DNA helicase PcrA
MDLLSSLNERQREAVTTTEGPLLILAGAGSGKTRVIVHRIAYLISERNVAPYNILAVTFTNKAAGEMRERVQRLLAGEKLSSAPLISTFHSLCVRILRVQIERLEEGYTRSFTIYDQDDSVRVVKAAIKDLGYDNERLGARSVQSAISHAKNQGLDSDDYTARVEYADERRAAIARVFKLYEERLVGSNALDFDDLMIKTVRLLRKDQQVRDHYNEKFRYILVDEYQDTNTIQFALIRFLTERQQNICVVGDESQSIYKWRGADIANILNFEQVYPEAKSIKLEQNYRSTQTILDVADAVIKHNTERKDKRLWTANPAGARVFYYQAMDADSEARFVAAKIEEHRRADPSLRAAVLYRTNAQSRVFEEAMRRAGLQYNIVGGFSFYERAEVRDIVSYLKLALNPHDSIAMMRVINTPPRGLGKQTLDELDRRAKDYGVSVWETISIINDPAQATTGFSPRALNSLKNFQKIITDLVSRAQRETASEVVKAAILDSGYADSLKSENSEEAESRLENLQELVNAAVDYDEEEGGGLRDFIDSAALVADTDDYERDAPVTLMTIHAAKGLEFPLVFIVGLEDGLFPHSRSATDPAELEEERRLCYVAITRAEKFLYVSHAMKRRVYGEELMSEPSQFLNEMPTEMLEDLTRGASWLSFARSSTRMEATATARALKGEPRGERRFEGKTYDSVDSIAEFFRQRGQQIKQHTPTSASNDERSTAKPTTNASQPVIKKRGEPSRSTSPDSSSSGGAGFVPGTHVRHPKYGRGLVLRREGADDSAKLTVSFPDFGQKKLIEKYAGLEKA